MRVLSIAALAVLAAVAADRPAFDVASVKPHHDDGKSPRNSRIWTPDSVTFGGCSLAFIIAEAYGITPGGVIGPGSLTKEALWPALSQGYDVIGKAGKPVSKQQLRQMLQTLLVDRFQLVAHRETQIKPAYKMTVIPGGLKLEESQDAAGSFDVSRTPEGYVFRNAELMRLGGFLSGRLDRTVVDETGVKGVYNFTLRAPEELAPSSEDKSKVGNTPDSPSASRVRNALKELGLQLTAGQAEVEYLVIDRVERPSGN
jgi:uncharacterized protein (TIGR03435 family)